MKSPFIFNKIVTGDKFVGRENEIKKLQNNFRDGINTFIISPRRTGKTSLVAHASNIFSQDKKNKNVVFVHLNLWNIRSEEEFFEIYANKVLKAMSSKFDDIVQYSKDFLSSLRPSVDVEYESIKLQLGLNIQKKEIDSILDLPQKLAEKKKKQIVVCLDEFQDIEHFNDALSFQKYLRSHWQNHNDVSYVLYGSKNHMLVNMFEDSSMPFYRFGDTIYLKPINKDKFVDFVVRNFQKTGKSIAHDQAGRIVELFKNHPYYIQQFFNVLWQNTDKTVTEELLLESMSDLLEYNSGQFDYILRSLTTRQLNFLRALNDDLGPLHSQVVLIKYNLGSSANVAAIKKALIDKEIISHVGDEYEFADVAFALYFRKTYGREEYTGYDDSEEMRRIKDELSEYDNL